MALDVPLPPGRAHAGGQAWLAPVRGLERLARAGGADRGRARRQAAATLAGSSARCSTPSGTAPRWRGTRQPLRGDRPPLHHQRDPGQHRAARGGGADHRARGRRRRRRAARLDHGVRRCVDRPAPHRRGPGLRRRRSGSVVQVDDRCSVAARVFRERRVVAARPGGVPAATADCGERAGYRGQAFLSVPICYGAHGRPLRCIGVINLTDRLGGDRFTPGDRKLVTAIANQIGRRDRERPAGRNATGSSSGCGGSWSWHTISSSGCCRRPPCCRATPRWRRGVLRPTSVGGDFYTFSRLGRGRVGVMLGDVASHGFSAALVMALVMSAAGIHAAAVGHARRDADRTARQSGRPSFARRRCTSACSMECSTGGPARCATPAPATRTPSAFRARASRSGCRRPRRRWGCAVQA